MANPLPQGRQQESRWEPGGLQARMAVTAGEMGHWRAAGQEPTAMEGPGTEIHGEK